jgi:uncharacterized protein (TIGR02271 family)
MLTQDQVQKVIGTEAYTQDGEKVGKIEQVYLDDATQQPAFATVHTGLFGMKQSFVPLERAEFDGHGLKVPYEKDAVKDAPRIDPDGHITPEEAKALYRHYGLEYGGPADPSQRTSAQGPTGTTDDAMTRSEEHLEVGTREEATGQVRLRKYVTTENVTTTVPVREERAVIEREPITEANKDKAYAGPEITESEHEVTLHKEVPVVGKEAKPVERVRLDKEEVADQEKVSDQVRKEQIEVEGDAEQR